MRRQLFTGFGSVNCLMIPHFCNHWLKYVPDPGDWHVCLHSQSQFDGELVLARDYLRGYGIYPEIVWSGEYTSLKLRNHLEALFKDNLGPLDWAIIPDADELVDLDEEMFSDSWNYIRGELWDHVSEDGSLPEIDPAADIWKQFPMVMKITGSILRGEMEKVVAFRSYLRPNRGLHALNRATAGKGKPMPKIVPVHHFKWDSTVIERLKSRISTYRRDGYVWWRESDRFIKHFESTGRIDVSRATRYERG